MSNAMIIKKKEAAEADMKREAQAMAEGQPQGLIRMKKVAKKEIEKVPPYVNYLAIYNEKNKEIKSVEHLNNTTLRGKTVKRDLKTVKERFFNRRHDLNNPQVCELNSSLKGYDWIALCTKQERKLFLLYHKDSRMTDVKSLISDLNRAFEKYKDPKSSEKDQKSSEKNQKISEKDIKKLIMPFLQKRASKQDVNTKMDNLTNKIQKIKQKIAKTAGNMATNYENLHKTDIIAENVKLEAAKIKDQATALADETSSISIVTIILVLVGCLLLIAVIGNLYVQIKAPPPKQMKAGLSTHFVSNFFKKTWKVLCKMGRATQHLFNSDTNIFSHKTKRYRRNTQNQRHSKSHQRAIHRHLRHRKRKIQKKFKTRRIKLTHKMDFTYSSVFKNKRNKNRSFSLSDYLTDRVANPSKSGPFDTDSSSKRGGHFYHSKLSFLI